LEQLDNSFVKVVMMMSFADDKTF